MNFTYTSPAIDATFTHHSLASDAWQTWRKAVVGHDRRPTLILPAIYSAIEYMSAPQGLIILAHQNTAAGQIDGIHPVELSPHVNDHRNIIEQFGGRSSGYAVHYLNRKQQGALVIGAYGRLVNPGDPEAHVFQTENGCLSLQVFNTARGPVACVWNGEVEVHVVQRGLSSIKGGKAA